MRNHSHIRTSALTFVAAIAFACTPVLAQAASQTSLYSPDDSPEERPTYYDSCDLRPELCGEEDPEPCFQFDDECVSPPPGEYCERHRQECVNWYCDRHPDKCGSPKPDPCIYQDSPECGWVEETINRPYGRQRPDEE